MVSKITYKSWYL